jgi:hypothetical protein
VTNNQLLREIVDVFCKEKFFSDIFHGADPIPRPVGSENSVWLSLDIEVRYGPEKYKRRYRISFVKAEGTRWEDTICRFMLRF